MATFTWAGGTSTDWTAPANWLTAGAPATVAPNSAAAAAADNIDGGGSRDAIISGGTSITVASLDIGNPTGTVVPGVVGGHVIVGGGPAIGGGGGGTLVSVGPITVTSTNSGGGLIGGPTATIRTPTLTLGSGAIIGGGGTFNVANLVNAGTIQADGGNFALGALAVTGGTISGTGSLEVDNNSTLDLGSATSENIAVSVGALETATVIFDNPSSFKGTLDLYQVHSHLNLFFAGQTPTAVSFDAQTHSLIITGTSGTIDTIPFISNGAVSVQTPTSTRPGYGEVSIGAPVAPSSEFDAAYYLAQNPDVAKAGVDPFTHFDTYGWKEGRNPDPYFAVRYYLNQNPDVAAAGIDPLTHYEQFGWKEGRDPSSTFGTKAYLQANPDVAAAKIDPLMHYLAHGATEGRMAFIATPHGVGQGNPLVDDTFYFSQYVDVKAAGVDPFAHYDANGWKEGRNPDALFDTKYYLQQSLDVAAAGIDPLLHYEKYGWLESRDPSAAFSTSKYLAANPDVKAAGVDPLVHYEQFGMKEGRAIFHV